MHKALLSQGVVNELESVQLLLQIRVVYNTSDLFGHVEKRRRFMLLNCNKRLNQGVRHLNDLLICATIANLTAYISHVVFLQMPIV